ncbi:hypothetical protein [Bowmanella yangjiangensis]|uniref:Uncharacterized protein n=1 Tax=Bowmanella yangjiangensis TaxID=2811230 RepID=A0ABS3CUL9_9ALTE|nr:hypothetical protein [Bowmanella yangjiangensis]MBN7820775.1 hypothetical protein [Bowmanella yangjiangensis]
MNSPDDLKHDELKGEAIFFTGAALVGGTKLVYDVGKDLYTRFKAKEKLFVQLIGSHFEDGCHVIRCRVANAYMHGISIAGVDIVDIHEEDFVVMAHNPIREIGFSSNIDTPAQFPIMLVPVSSCDWLININEITHQGIRKIRGIELVVRYATIDSLSDFQEIRQKVRLQWGS